MNIHLNTILSLIVSVSLPLLSIGCSKQTKEKTEVAQTTPQTKQKEKEADKVNPKPHRHRHGPVKLGGSSASTDTHTHSKSASGETRHQILEAMNPLQVMLGTWQGKTQRSKVVDNINWVWDFKTDAKQPALVMESDKSPLFKKGRFTFLTKKQKYQLIASDDKGVERTLQGDFSVDVADEYGDDNKLHRTYKLQLTQVAPTDSKLQWQLVFNQKDNNRYLIELSRKRGKAKFARYETIASQRVGTSFASIDPDDYKEKTCIITQGLGTMQVSHKGKSYWVCCSGCKAAFEEDPETWIAEFEKKKKN